MMNKEEERDQQESSVKLKKSSVSIYGAFKDACKNRPSSVNFNSSFGSTTQENKASSFNQQPQSLFMSQPDMSDQTMIYPGSIPNSMTSSEPLKFKKNKETSSVGVPDSMTSTKVLNHFSSGYILDTAASGHLMETNSLLTWKSDSEGSLPVSSLGSILSGSSPESTDSIPNSRDLSTFLLMANEIAHRHQLQQEIEYISQEMIADPANLHSRLGYLTQENQSGFSNHQLQSQFMNQRCTSGQIMTYPGSIPESVAASKIRKKKTPSRRRSKSMTSRSSSESMSLANNQQRTTPVRRKRKLLPLSEDEADGEEDQVDPCKNEQPIDLSRIIEVFNCM